MSLGYHTCRHCNGNWVFHHARYVMEIGGNGHMSNGKICYMCQKGEKRWRVRCPVCEGQEKLRIKRLFEFIM